MMNGKLVINSRGDERWMLNGLRHRLDGPAIIWADGHKAWLINGKLHRLDGPAVIFPDGNKRWFINGIGYTEYQFNEYHIILAWRYIHNQRI